MYPLCIQTVYTGKVSIVKKRDRKEIGEFSLFIGCNFLTS